MKTLVPSLALLVIAAAPPAEPDRARPEDTCVLHHAGVRSDGPGLVAFFREQSLTAERRRDIAELVKQLGDDTFEVREKATRALIALESPAVAALQRALKHRDLEVSRRAKRCLDAFGNISPTELRAAAARVLVVRKPTGAVGVLLDFLPDVADAAEEGRIVAALEALGVREGTVDRALVTALADKVPVRRAVAAEVLAAVGGARDRAAASKLLGDADRAVRLHVAVALACARERDAVPALIDVTADLPPERTAEARELLRTLAGARAPRAAPRGAKYRDEWNAWWKEHGAGVDLGRAAAGPPGKAKVAARASAVENKDFTPDKAFDVAAPNGWAAGNYAPQWIEADLGASRRPATLRMTPSQSPAACDATHEIWVSDAPIGEDRTRATLAHVFKGRTEDGRPLAWDFPTGLSARYVQIRTTASESWVAWRRIELQAGRTRTCFMPDEG
jgi:hypothetical protein